MTSCLPPWRKQPFQSEIFSYGKEFVPTGANFSFKEFTPIQKRGNNKSLPSKLNQLQPSFSGSNRFGTMKRCSRQGSSS